MIIVSDCLMKWLSNSGLKKRFKFCCIRECFEKFGVFLAYRKMGNFYDLSKR
ncbi:MAG: hypothetical protein CM15mP22_3760 [Gammaproteobacteria bacterium]|nr:MAG: hypothetical protein CM15mP22_3760 [Gammaproteobacteria bacterium]